MATSRKTVQETPETEEEILETPETQVQEKAKAEDVEAMLKRELERLKAENEKLRRRAGTNPTEAYRIVKEACEECAKAGRDPWLEKIEIFVPHRSPHEDPWYWININGISAQIPANDTVQELKLPWAEALVSTLRNERLSEEYQDSLEVKDPKNNPHDE